MLLTWDRTPDDHTASDCMVNGRGFGLESLQ